MLEDSIRFCRLCPEMDNRTKVFSELNGNISSNVLFIAEAPGRLGADRTAIPLCGDQTGVNFQRLVDTIGWSRGDFFITNSVLCNPRNSEGNNVAPSRNQVRSCSVYLDLLIEVMDPEFVITLGQKALDAIGLLSPCDVSLRNQVRSVIPWNGRSLIPLYHTGPRALIHRSFYNQLADFYWIKEKVRIRASDWKPTAAATVTHRLKAVHERKLSRLQKVVVEILKRTGEISRFKLTKLLYLSDYRFLTTYGRLMTDAYYLRAYDGPMPGGLNRQLAELDDWGLAQCRGRIVLRSSAGATVGEREAQILEEILRRYGQKNESELKTATYLTQPMKRILRAEKQNRVSMIWKPVFTESDFGARDNDRT